VAVRLLRELVRFARRYVAAARYKPKAE